MYYRSTEGKEGRSRCGREMITKEEQQRAAAPRQRHTHAGETPPKLQRRASIRHVSVNMWRRPDVKIAAKGTVGINCEEGREGKETIAIATAVKRPRSNNMVMPDASRWFYNLLKCYVKSLSGNVLVDTLWEILLIDDQSTYSLV